MAATCPEGAETGVAATRSVSVLPVSEFNEYGLADQVISLGEGWDDVLDTLHCVRTAKGSMSLLSPEVLQALMLKTIDVVEARADAFPAECLLRRGSMGHARSLDVVIRWCSVSDEVRRYRQARQCDFEPRESCILDACVDICCMLLGYYRCLVEKVEDPLPSGFRVLDPRAVHDFLVREVFPVTRHKISFTDGQRKMTFNKLRELILSVDKVPLFAPKWLLDHDVDDVSDAMYSKMVSLM